MTSTCRRSSDDAARVAELEAELSKWKRECKEQRSQKQKLATERVELANRFAEVQFTLKQIEAKGLDPMEIPIESDNTRHVREKIDKMSKQLAEAELVTRQLQQHNKQLEAESTQAAAMAAAQTASVRASAQDEQDGSDSDEDIEMQQLLAVAREARLAAEMSQEQRLQERSLAQHLAAARIQRRYREQSGRRVLKELRSAAAGTVQNAWGERPATAPGGGGRRALTPNRSDGRGRQQEQQKAAGPLDHMMSGPMAGGPMAGMGGPMAGGMGGMPGGVQQAKIDADMAWLASMGMPVSDVRYGGGGDGGGGAQSK